MSESIKKLAEIFLNPPPEIGVTTGTVISVSPLKVRVMDGITAAYPRLWYSDGLSFEVGDKVIISASSGNQSFYILGKAVIA